MEAEVHGIEVLQIKAADMYIEMRGLGPAKIGEIEVERKGAKRTLAW